MKDKVIRRKEEKNPPEKVILEFCGGNATQTGKPTGER